MLGSIFFPASTSANFLTANTMSLFSTSFLILRNDNHTYGFTFIEKTSEKLGLRQIELDLVGFGLERKLHYRVLNVNEVNCLQEGIIELNQLKLPKHQYERLIDPTRTHRIFVDVDNKTIIEHTKTINGLTSLLSKTSEAGHTPPAVNWTTVNLFSYGESETNKCAELLKVKIRNGIATFKDQSLTYGEDEYIKYQIVHHIIKKLLDPNVVISLNEVQKEDNGYRFPSYSSEQIIAFHQKWKQTSNGNVIDLFTNNENMKDAMSKLLEKHIINAISALDISLLVKQALTAYRET